MERIEERIIVYEKALFFFQTKKSNNKSNHYKMKLFNE